MLTFYWPYLTDFFPLIHGEILTSTQHFDDAMQLISSYANTPFFPKEKEAKF